MSGADKLDSPFLQEESFAPDSHAGADPRLERFVQKSPFAAIPVEEERNGKSLKTPALTPLGKPDYWPDVVYIVKPGGDSFLNTAWAFHKLWGLKPVEFEHLEGLIGLIAKAKSPGKRIRIVSHASEGFLIPLFKGSPTGFDITRKQIEALNKDNDGPLMDEFLGKLTNLSISTDKGVFAWNALLTHLEADSRVVLTPFKFSSRTQPSGDSELLLRRCADLVAVARMDPALSRAVRKSIAGAVSRLGRTETEGNALAEAVRRSGFTFPMSTPDKDFLLRVKAAIGALDNRAFRNTLKDAQKKLNDKWVDFRGCRIGSQKPFLKAFVILMGGAGCTAPDWWSGYPGEAPIRDNHVSTATSFTTVVNSSPAAKAAMNRWGAREVPGWSAGDADRFFNEFLKAGKGVLPVYEAEYSAFGFRKETHTLHWSSGKGKQRWLESMWDGNTTKQAQAIAAKWGSTPPMPTLSRHLKASTTTSGDPQEIFVAPEPEFRGHIIEVVKP